MVLRAENRVDAGETSAPRPDTAPVADDPGLTAADAPLDTRGRWRAELAGIGGPSPLVHFEDSVRTRIELSTTHPSGLAQFITGKTTLLSNLIRDDIAFRTASAAASTLTAKAVELAATRGIDAMHLAVGLAEWRFEKQDFAGPVLLRPLAIRRYGRDFELRLKGALVLNPGLVRALATQFGVELDARAFVALAQEAGAFKPQPVIDRLRAETRHLPFFTVQPRLLISSFAEVGPALEADAARLDHPLLDAVAGDAVARQAIRDVQRPAVVPADDRPPAVDQLLLDADAGQEAVVAAIAAGATVAVHAMPGTGSTQTIVNALGMLVAQHKRVLVVAPRHATLRAVATRFTELGLTGLAASVRTMRRDVIQAITRSEKAEQPETGDVDDALVRLRQVLAGYRSALARPDGPGGVGVLEALGELSRLALLPVPPATTARLSDDAAAALAHNRASVRTLLERAAALGEFRFGPADSPWYGASFPDAEAAQSAHATAKRLAGSVARPLIARCEELVAAAHLRPFASLAELGTVLKLLLDVRDTLDKFQPAVFDRSLGELIVATGPRRDAREMSSVNRRRLTRLAKEYLRPGVRVADLHEWLVRVQQQRVLHQRFAVGGRAPEVPAGIAEVWDEFQRFAADVAALDGPLHLAGTADSLLQEPIDTLPHRLDALAADSSALAHLQERSSIMARLRSLGLTPLTDDLAGRHVGPEEVGAELELAWWKTVLERLLAVDPALLGANTAVVDRLEQDFRLVDESHQAANARRLAWQLADAWRLSLDDRPQEAEALKQVLQRGIGDPTVLDREAPHLLKLLSPVWLASPYEVHLLGDQVRFDTVVVLDAGALSIAEAAGAIRRGTQVVAFGDPVTETPAPFDIAVRETDPSAHEPQRRMDERHGDSVFARVAELSPPMALQRSYRAGGEDLAEVVNRRFYEGRIESLPWAGTFLGHGSLVLDYVDDGAGLPDVDSGAVESTEPEVQRVVDRVLDHAERRARESLMVVSGSAKHAVRVQQAVMKALVRKPDLAEFFVRDHPEPFLVVPLGEAVGHSRDRVILSVGFGRTPHGRTLSALGPLAGPGGDRLLAAAVTRARRSLTVVTCFRPDDLDADRMPAGVLALRRLLADAEARGVEQPLDDDRDAMLVDLAARLRTRGLTAVVGYHGTLALAVSHGTRAMTVETDATLAGGSLRERLRLTPGVLKRLGWRYLRVHSFDLFADPDRVADRIAVALGAMDPAPADAAPLGSAPAEVPV